MAKHDLSLEMGNLICKFGNKNFMDYFDEIVLPAFTDSSLVRKYGETKYFFEKVSLVDVDGQLVLAGRLIKDTILEREQVYEQGKGVVPDHDKMRSAPSSVFAIVLSVHRVILVKETKFAPTLDVFKSTLERFLKEKYKAFINAEWSAAGGKGGDVTKKQLTAKHISPSLEIIPLSSAQDVAGFIKQYETLSSVTYTFSDRNDEQDNEQLFELLQKQKDDVGSKVTKVSHSNKEGLDKDSVIEEVQSATAQGTQRVRLSGKDSEGNTLVGDNDSFKLNKKVEVLVEEPESMAKVIVGVFNDLVSDGLIRVFTPPKSVLAKLAKYIDTKG